jgi:hypothetical protein
LTLDVHGDGDGEDQDGGRAEGEVPAVAAGRRDERRVRLVGRAMRGGEDGLVELARRLLAALWRARPRELRVAIVSHRRAPP